MSEFEQLRVRIPPIEALRKYPNWTSCLDEELELVDADTSLKVASNQTAIDSSIACTAAVASIEGLGELEAAFGAYLTVGAVPEYVVFYCSSGVIVLQSDALQDHPVSSPVRIRSVAILASTSRWKSMWTANSFRCSRRRKPQPPRMPGERQI